jgi:hypothetical protein
MHRVPFLKGTGGRRVETARLPFDADVLYFEAVILRVFVNVSLPSTALAVIV